MLESYGYYLRDFARFDLLIAGFRELVAPNSRILGYLLPSFEPSDRRSTLCKCNVLCIKECREPVQRKHPVQYHSGEVVFTNRKAA
ncbi:hypothetical protein IQ268_20855 [Oculatella sp. LEGE 06141]|uniref:hypothetical protein n=1 Tax=Oculatella sp. LEGE 06141 TaxID=1828648 RepID=UPI00187E0415|nr:hypothetical protein [Oculatella sp. LEGE 06141]MBE9181013.1 hypothetical protein [Oculatella sp. LEGE 06141]